jgi:hypothetical protein
MGADARHGQSRSEDGFTLVEIVVALGILTTVAVGFMMSAGIGFRTVAVARQREIASELASARLEHLRNVPFEQVALSSAPTHDSDPEHPDYWVSSPNPTHYDISGGDGQWEELIIDAANGDVLNVEDPVTVGSTVMEIYQYATWVDDATIAGTHDYRRVTVVVRYKAPASSGVNKLQRASTLFTSGTVTVGAPSSTTTTISDPTTTTTAPPATTSTTAAGPCAGDTAAPVGGFTIGASGDAEVGFSASSNVSLQLLFTDACTPIVVNFSNDGNTWGADVTYDATSPQVSWSLPAGDGTKSVYGRVRDGAGNMVTLSQQSVVVDATAPTAPGNVVRTVSCSGSNRTATLSWIASTDTNLRGYRVYRSTDGSTWSQLGSTTSTSYANTHAKTLNSVRFYVVAYDKAGNISVAAPNPVISLAKNQCS